MINGIINSILWGTSGGGGSTNTIHDVLFNTGIIYRNNATLDLSAVAAGVTVANARWEVRRMDNNTLVAMDYGMSVNLSVTEVGYYKIIFKAQTSTYQYVKQWNNVTVWYPKFGESGADVVIDMASGNYYNDFASADNHGKKYFIKNSGTGYVAMLNLWGTTGGFQNYARVEREEGEVQTGVSGADMITFTGARYVFIDGYNSDGSPGWEAINPTGGLFEFRCENSAPVTNLHVGGLKLYRSGASNDRASISIIPPVNVTYNATNWVYDKMAIHGCRIENSGAEGIYVMYTNDNPQSTYTPPKARDIIIAYNTVINAGNDGIQNSSCVGRTHIHDNHIDTWGIQGSSGHEAAFSWNEGNAGQLYNNYAINGKMFISGKSGLYPYDIQAGESSPAALYIYNNVGIEGTPPAVGSTEPVFNYIQVNNSASTATWPVHFVHNTMIANKLGITFAFNSAGGYRIPNLSLFNNAFIKTGGSNEYAYTGAGTYPSSAVINNVVRSFSSYADLLFTSSTDLRPSSLSSPLFTGATDTSSIISGIDLNDADGFPLYDGTAYTNGAYSRDDLKNIANTGDAVAATFTTPVAVGSLTQTGGTVTFETNKEGVLYVVMVANGDSAPSAAQIIAGQNAAGTAAIGSIAILDGGTAGSGVIGGGSEGTAYDVYSVFKTKDFVVGSVQTKIDITTTADTTAPVLSGWEIRNANPNRLYFISSKIITGTTYGGFTIDQILGTTVTVTGITINSGQLTDHYFTLSSSLGAIDYLARIAYSGSGSNIQDTAGTPNALASFAATSITNSITATRINVNIDNFGTDHTGNWNNPDIAGSGAVRTLTANLINSNGSNTGYALAIQEAFHNSTAIATTGGGLYLDSVVGARGVECYSTSPTSNAGTFRISGLAAGATGQIVYGTKGIFNTPTGTVSVTGGSAVAFANAYTEYRQSFVADGSGNLDITMTETTSNASICMVGFIVEVNP